MTRVPRQPVEALDFCEDSADPAVNMQMRTLVMIIPPPLFYVAAFGLGLLIDRVAPSARQLLFVGAGARMPSPTTIAGVVLVLTGGFLGPLNAVRFLFKRTTLIPTEQPTLFLTHGMYRVSRNPMYLGLFLLYVGIALLNRAAGPLVTILIPFLVMNGIVVPFEESQMAARFGSSYVDYCSRVRRWLTLRAPSASRA